MIFLMNLILWVQKLVLKVFFYPGPRGVGSKWGGPGSQGGADGNPGGIPMGTKGGGYPW